jgi:signal recognition particle subunit SRP54
MERMRAVQDIARSAGNDPSGQIRVQKQRSRRGPVDVRKAKDIKKKKRRDARKSRKKNR